MVARLIINYHFIVSEARLQKRDYAGKDRAVQFIYNSYRNLTMNDDDSVNTAKYFSHYSKFDWALQLLTPLINSLSASEDFSLI